MPILRLPRYPIYIPTKGRAKRCLTAKALLRDYVPFKLVVEAQEYDAYAAEFGEDVLLTLPFANLGSVIPARNWIKEHALLQGVKRHWQLDDNINGAARLYRGKKIPCAFGVALVVCEEFTERYTNVALSGLNYRFLVTWEYPPFFVNARVYSCCLVLNDIPYQWRGSYNEDADLCLQVLSGNYCTLLINAFLINKIASMKMKGGNTTELYQDDGRAKMARSLERLWPGVVTTHRRWHRPQHKVFDKWRRFDTPLILREDVGDEKPFSEQELRLVQVKPTKSKSLHKLVADRIDEDA